MITGRLARGLIVVALLALLTASTVVPAPAFGHEPASGSVEAEARGLRDLGLGPPDPAGPCGPGGYEVRAPGGAAGCTHGPDPAPDGVDLRHPRTLASLQQTLEADGQLAATPSAPVPCIGNGTAGRRIVAIYAWPTGGSNRYTEVLPLIQGWAAEADALVDASAARTRGSRHLRWQHGGDCRVAVQQLRLSTAAISDLSVLMAELSAAGFNRADRRYLVWFDVDYLCGVAVNVTDDSPGQTNRNNGVATGLVHFGRVDRGCWGLAAPNPLVELHEILHTLGAVQPTSPNSSSLNLGGGQYVVYGHCVDIHDVMCYADGSPKPLVERCPISNVRFLDCRNDDYFHTSPPSGSYLARHWNVADSSFLVTVDPIAGFLDLDGSMFAADVAWIAARRITGGCSADRERYCPKALVTREQMASFLVRALTLPPSSIDRFSDDEGSLHEGDINALAAAGITGGCAAGRYCPRGLVTREQMASFLVRALKLRSSSVDRFGDDDASIHEPDINALAAAGVTGGCTATRFCPRGTVTREQMAAFLRRGLTK